MDAAAAELRLRDEAIAREKEAFVTTKMAHEKKVEELRAEYKAKVLAAMTPEQRRVFDYHTERRALAKAQAEQMTKLSRSVFTCDVVTDPRRPWAPGVNRRSFVMSNAHGDHAGELLALRKKHGFTSEPRDEFESIR